MRRSNPPSDGAGVVGVAVAEPEDDALAGLVLAPAPRVVDTLDAPLDEESVPREASAQPPPPTTKAPTVRAATGTHDRRVVEAGVSAGERDGVASDRGDAGGSSGRLSDRSAVGIPVRGSRSDRTIESTVGRSPPTVIWSSGRMVLSPSATRR